MRTIYDTHGGFPTVRKVVSDFYARVLDEEQLVRHFATVDMARLIDHQTKFVSFLLGGPASFSDDHLERVHHHLGISLDEFEVMVQLLLETLEDHRFTVEEVAVVEVQLRKRLSLVVRV